MFVGLSWRFLQSLHRPACEIAQADLCKTADNHWRAGFSLPRIRTISGSYPRGVRGGVRGGHAAQPSQVHAADAWDSHEAIHSLPRPRHVQNAVERMEEQKGLGGSRAGELDAAVSEPGVLRRDTGGSPLVQPERRAQGRCFCIARWDKSLVG